MGFLISEVYLYGCRRRREGTRGSLRSRWSCRSCFILPPYLAPADPLFRALSGRLKFMVRRHKFNKGALSFSTKRYGSRRSRGGTRGSSRSRWRCRSCWWSSAAPPPRASPMYVPDHIGFKGAGAAGRAERIVYERRGKTEENPLGGNSLNPEACHMFSKDSYSRDECRYSHGKAERSRWRCRSCSWSSDAPPLRASPMSLNPKP